jgi:hypothetical protein
MSLTSKGSSVRWLSYQRPSHLIQVVPGTIVCLLVSFQIAFAHLLVAATNPVDLSAQNPPSIILSPVEIKAVKSPVKITQLIGDYDRQFKKPTENLTIERYQLPSTDLGIPFLHKGRTYLAFGDVWIDNGDPIAWSEDTNLEDGLSLNFITNSAGHWKPINIPGVALGGFDAPSEAVSVDGNIYLWYGTDATPNGMTRSVLARSSDDGSTFSLVRSFSTSFFVNVSVVNREAAEWPGSPALQGSSLYIFGSGTYRQSNVRLAFGLASEIEGGNKLKYFAGLVGGLPTWSSLETDALSLFENPVVGELSVAFDEQLSRWIMLYNSSSPRGIVLRTAVNPWGPWSKPFVLFEPRRDNGYCHFLHSNWSVEHCDEISDPGRENEWGGEYGPYMFKHLAKNVTGGRRIYFTISTWNPYTVILMKADIARLPPSTADRPTIKAGAVTSSNLSLSWQAPSFGWFLEYKKTLSTQDSWLKAVYSPKTENSEITVLIPEPAEGFYRLRKR